jgi:hypothetical protein
MTVASSLVKRKNQMMSARTRKVQKGRRVIGIKRMVVLTRKARKKVLLRQLRKIHPRKRDERRNKVSKVPL